MRQKIIKMIYFYILFQTLACFKLNDILRFDLYFYLEKFSYQDRPMHKFQFKF